MESWRGWVGAAARGVLSGASRRTTGRGRTDESREAKGNSVAPATAGLSGKLGLVRSSVPACREWPACRWPWPREDPGPVPARPMQRRCLSSMNGTACSRGGRTSLRACERQGRFATSKRKRIARLAPRSGGARAWGARAARSRRRARRGLTRRARRGATSSPLAVESRGARAAFNHSSG